MTRPSVRTRSIREGTVLLPKGSFSTFRNSKEEVWRSSNLVNLCVTRALLSSNLRITCRPRSTIDWCGEPLTTKTPKVLDLCKSSTSPSASRLFYSLPTSRRLRPSKNSRTITLVGRRTTSPRLLVCRKGSFLLPSPGPLTKFRVSLSSTLENIRQPLRDLDGQSVT